MITQIQGDFNSTPAMTFKRTGVKGGKIFLKNRKLKCWCTAFCTIPRNSPTANPQPTSLAAAVQLTACLLRSPSEEAALVHKTSTSYKTSFSPTLLNNALSLALHSLCRRWSMEVGSTLEPVTPAWSSLWVRAALLRCYTALAASSQVRIYQEVSADDSISPNTSAWEKAIVIICFCPCGSCLYQITGPGKLYQLIPVIKRTALCS